MTLYFFFIAVPMPPLGELKVRDVTHSTMWLYWDAAPGPVRQYIVTYKSEDGDVKQVRVVSVLRRTFQTFQY